MTTIHSRASWGARYRDGVGNRAVGRLEKYLHHGVTAHLPTTATVAQEQEQMRVLERIGQNRFRAGISYTFVIFPSGRIYQGASVHRISYHSGPGRNTRGAAICLAGNYDVNPLEDKALNAVVDLLKHGVARGWWTDPALTEAHRDFKGTACPGRFAYAKFKQINEAARGKITTAQTPAPKPVAVRVPENSANSAADNAAIARLLNALGYDAGAPDGVPGPRLRDGVKAYQTAQVYFPGLKVDGDWGRGTQEHYEWVRDVLQPGVAKWKASARLGALAADGDYKAKTARHVRAVQTDNYDQYRRLGGYYQDGLAARITCKLLGIKPHPRG